MTSHEDLESMGVKPRARCDSCRFVIDPDELRSPVLQANAAVLARESTWSRLSDVSKKQVLWNSTMCDVLKLPEGYANVAVIMIRWRESDWVEEIDKEITDLKDIFEKSFGYAPVEVLELTGECVCHLGPAAPACGCTEGAQSQLDSQVIGFVDRHGAENNLIIVYYSGHGTYHRDTQLLELSGLELRKHPPSVIWNVAEEKLICKAKCDVLTIMDTCFAGGVSTTVKESHGRSYEYLGASGPDAITAPPGKRSYTRALISSLQQLVDKMGPRAFTTADLQQAIDSQKYRVGKPGILKFRKINDRRIILQPISTETKKYFNESKRVKAHLNLQIELTEDNLSDTDTERLAKLFSKALLNSHVKARRIDFLSLKQKTRPTWKEASKRALSLHNTLKAVGVKFPLGTIPERPILPFSGPGLFATFGWISPHLHLRTLTIPRERPWSAVLLVVAVGFAWFRRSLRPVGVRDFLRSMLLQRSG